METEVKLQESFSYALWPIIVLGALVVVCVLILVICKFKKKVKEKPVVEKETVKQEKYDVNSIKRKYIAELDQISVKLANGMIETRQAYLDISDCIRRFVHKVTGINAQTCTLEDIKKMDMPKLEVLMTEYYAPEFAYNSVADANESIMKTKRAIEEWN